MSEARIEMVSGDKTTASTEGGDIAVTVEPVWDNRAEEMKLRVSFTGYGTEWGTVTYDGWTVNGLAPPGMDCEKSQ